MTLLPSSTAATALAAINSIGVTTKASVNAQETDIKKAKQLHLVDDTKQHQTAADLANSAPSIVKKRFTAAMKPDVGILSKDFFKSKGREEQPIGKQFAIHRKKQAVKVDVDVGILDNGRRQQTSGANLHVKNEVAGRSLQSDEKNENTGRHPLMCPNKYDWPGSFYFPSLFNQTDHYNFTEEGYFPKCSCPSPTTCGPVLCECLELDADGDIFQCMDPFKQLCEGTKYIEGIPGPWSFEECLGYKFFAIPYCSYLPCFVDGGSWWQCKCNHYDSMCTEYRSASYCARSKCCQAQTDDEGREACLYEGLYQNYYDQVTSLSISKEEMISRFNECSFNSGDDKSIVQCYCESFSYGLCVNWGVSRPDYCEAMHCCYEQTEDDARLDCFTRFRDWYTGRYFHSARNELQESCIGSGKSSDQCKCDIHGLSNCVGVGVEAAYENREPRCYLFQCCKSETGDDDEGRKDCLVQDEAQLVYIKCISDGNTTESCLCDKSKTLCSSGHSSDRHCELSSCCQAQADDTGREECIGNFTTSQPSSAPSDEILPPTDASPASSPSTGDQVLEDNTLGTANSSNSNLLESKKVRKALVTAVLIGWLLPY